ncbi:MAG TPA: hypothetical protein VGR35_02555 [Tepidisphaeraceae bacterium]|nr:hypothetical protein [Tepidisphaeraceae bacterium]
MTDFSEKALHQELGRVATRYRRLVLWTGLMVCWLILAIAGAAALAWARGTGYAIPGVVFIALLALPLVFFPMLLTWLRRVRSPNWVAHRVERKFSDLDARLLTALEQQPDEGGRLGFLQLDVMGQVVAHAQKHGWDQVVSRRKLRLAKWGQWGALALFAVVVANLALDLQKRPSQGGFWFGGIARRYDIKIEPQDTIIQRGTGLLVLARFDHEVPTDVTLTYRDADGHSQQIQMSRSLDDPVFAGRVPVVNQDLSYVVKYADQETRPYKVTVFDYPELKQADARLTFPEYTKLQEKLVEDTRAITAVEGTRATLTFRLNKPVAQATLVPVVGGKDATTRPAPLPLVVDPSDPSVYTLALDMTQSQRYALDLVDADGRKPKQTSELTLNVTPNRPPDLKLAFPGRDIDVSPLQEMAVHAQVWDDFGIARVGLSYALAGKEPKDVVLAEEVKGKETRDVAHLVSLEQLAAEPDELLSYYLWVEDLGPDGAVRRTVGDMFFAEVRPFELIYRQGQQPSESEQQQQQQQGQSANAQQAEELAELQKQIINATWKVIRREIKAQPTQELAKDGKLLHESQQSARKQAAALAQRLEDPRSKQHLQSVLKHMDSAITELNDVRGGPSIAPLSPAVAAEQAAYQQLLKLRAREYEVVRQNRRQQQGQQSASSSQTRRQEQLNELELQQDDNRYEAQRRAQQEQQNQLDPAAREQRQVLNRLRELAQRQEDLNRQMKDLQAALQKAQEEQEREELQRQLARLRDQQQEMLRDTDELRDRMDQPQNQQQMADSREQLEQTRENVRRASEALERGMVPEATASGARAAEQLNTLRDEFRRGTAEQLAEEMNELRKDARELDRRQQELANQMNQLDQTEQRKLRDAGERKQVAEGLAQQREQLSELLKEMQRTTEEAEASEPLVSRQLQDAAREALRHNPDQALNSSSTLLSRGFLDEAREVEADANKGLTKLREGVERAADSVLGDETEGLRRASDQLEQLAQELERELASNGQTMGPTSRPSSSRRQIAQRDGPTTRQVARAGEPGEGEQQPGAEQQQPGEPQARSAGEQREQEASATRGVARSGEGGEAQQRHEQQPGQRQQQVRAGDQQDRDEQQQQQGGGQQEGPAQSRKSRAQVGGGLRGGEQQGRQQQANAGDPQQQGEEGDLRRLVPDLTENRGNSEQAGAGPMSGGGEFREWSDRLRDVEEMVGDPRLRAEAARIRERARSLRAEANRHSKEPNWELVREFVGRPLVELRDQVADELMRRQTREAMVPIDREPVPPQYVDQVREYYERLGSGR